MTGRINADIFPSAYVSVVPRSVHPVHSSRYFKTQRDILSQLYTYIYIYICPELNPMLVVCPFQGSSRASVASPGIGLALARNPLRGGPEFVDICTTVIQSYLDAQLVFLAGRFPVASGVQTEAPELAFRFDVRSPDPYTITMTYRMGKPCGLVDMVRPVGGVHLCSCGVACNVPC